MTDKTDQPDGNHDEAKPAAPEEKPVAKAGMDPVRKWTLIILGACVVLFAWYLISDRVTPYTSQARVHALVVPIAPEVSGIVTEVSVGTNQYVEAGDLLFRIDPERYDLEVETAEANLQSARQQTGAAEANVEVARAALGSARAGLIKAEQDAVRLRRIKKEDPGAISDRRLEIAEASLSVAIGQVDAAQAGLEMAERQLGQIGDDNSLILQAQAALEQARLNLEHTEIVAPDDGLISDVRVDRGNFAQAGAPTMTFIAVHNVWVQADFTENNLGRLKEGDPAGLVFDALPGRVYEGWVRESGFGVAVNAAPLGSLPTIENDRQWLRSAQRFPVVIDFAMEDSDEARGLRVGAQVSVIIYTGENAFLNALGRFQLWMVSKLTYAY